MNGLSVAAVKLKRWRVTNDLTQMEAAKLLDTYPNYISLWERGLRLPELRNAVLVEKEVDIPCRDWYRKSRSKR